MKISGTGELASLIGQIKSKRLETNANFNEFLQSNMKFDEAIKAIKSTSQNVSETDAVGTAIFSLGDTFAETVNTADENGFFSVDMQRRIKEDADMFKTFDFMQIVNQLVYGDKTESEKRDLLNRAIKISQEI